ncbi:MAG: methylenetetrahydrofolate reductase [Microbacteriaceae bacterium]|nr:methylenetetrahydrofolate reductase [Microbacteriaceae bacterium]
MALDIPGRLAAARLGQAPRHSCELFPPRNDIAALQLGLTIDRLAATEPMFFSVTFGAGGSTRDRSLTVLTYILRHTRVRPVAHLTAVGSDVAEATTRIQEFLDVGIEDFLALRGDPPADRPDELGAFGSASELVDLIHRVAGGDPGDAPARTPHAPEWYPDAKVAAEQHVLPPRPVVAVAAFPSGHPRQASRWADLDALLEKQAAGARYAITQAFFQADEYLEYVARARAAGVTMEIVPGIAPLTQARRLVRLAELAGQEPPAELLAALQNAPSPEAAAEIGIGFATDLVVDVLAGGAPSVHYFTFNEHESTLRVLDAVAERTGAAARDDALLSA